MRALNIEVSPELLARWVGWFAPGSQPFLVDDELADAVGEPSDPAPLTAELIDTFELYGIPDGQFLIWFSESDFVRLPRRRRAALVRAQRRFGRGVVPSVRSCAFLGDAAREQADGHRFVWWSSLLDGNEEQVLTGYIEEGRRPSRHDEVPAEVWHAADMLPAARRLAGTFAASSGPNCFGTVMAAAGVAGADQVWMQREPFEQWLSERTRPGGRDDEPGTVLVWRSPDGLVQHAAVTLGAEWALHKPSQGWMSPTKVLTVPEAKRSSRDTGRHLHRYSITT